MVAGPPALRFTTTGRFRVLNGDEIYLNGVVIGKRTVEITIRMQPKPKAVNTNWFMRDTRDNRRFNIKLMTPSEKGDFITFRAEGGNRVKINTISIEPMGGYDKETVAQRLAKVQVFLSELQMTIRDIILTHDHEGGYAAKPGKPKNGQAAMQWVVGSPFAKAVAEAAAGAYCSMLAEDIAELKELYASAS